MTGVDVTSPCVSSSFYLVPSSGAVTIPFCKISRPGHVRSELDLPLDISVPAFDIFLCCQDCLARTESERAFMLQLSNLLQLDFLFSNTKVMLWVSLETNV